VRRRLIAELDVVGWLRERSDRSEVHLVAAATLARLGGASGVSLRLAEPGSALERDASLLRAVGVRNFQLVLPANASGLKVALEIRPDCVIWSGEGNLGAAPEALDVAGSANQLAVLTRSLNEARIRSGVLVVTVSQQIKAAHRLGTSALRIAAQG